MAVDLENGTTTEREHRGMVAFQALIGLAAIAILLQGLWAGIFLEHDGKRDDAENWVTVHAHGGEVAIALAALAAIAAFVLVRQRRDLWIGSAVLVVLLLVESYIGGQIVDNEKDSWTAVHVPLAMAIMGFAVWLPFRAMRRPTARTGTSART